MHQQPVWAESMTCCRVQLRCTAEQCFACCCRVLDWHAGGWQQHCRPFSWQVSLTFPGLCLLLQDASLAH